jgi:hypothetical protein
MTVEFNEPGQDVTCSHFDNILNLRDVGKTVNQFTRKKYCNFLAL